MKQNIRSIKSLESTKLICVLLSLLLFSQNCLSDSFDIESFSYADPEFVFNTNVQSVRQLVLREEYDRALTEVDSSDVNAYVFRYKGQEPPVVICRNSQVRDAKWPLLSIKPDASEYYWTLGNVFLLDDNGQKILVKDNGHIPHFNYSDGVWSMMLDATNITIADSLLSKNFVSVSTNENGLTLVSFPSSYQQTIPMDVFCPPVVPLKSFYKDVFLDAGIGLTSRKSLAAAKYLGLSTEGISLPRNDATVEDSILQNTIVAGDEDDANGRLLYPDGQPRFKLLFVNGGNSRMHGQSLCDGARNNMQHFVGNGGCYVGTCAGAFFASNGYDGKTDYPYYLNLFPATMNHTGLSGTTTGMFIENGSPLLEYYDFGSDYYVSEVRHNKGGYPVMLPSGTEVLARFDYPGKDDVHLQPCAWSYKPDIHTGRVVLEASHPEEVSDGERRDLTAALMLYAMDGIGLTPLKGFLQNGKTRTMDCDAGDASPLHAKIGDLQCHHFAVNIPEGVESFMISFHSASECDFSLSVNYATFAYPEDAEFICTGKELNTPMSIPSPKPGVWYVCVKNRTTVKTIRTDYGQSYLDSSGVLNGTPYQVTASWQTREKSKMVASTGDIPQYNRSCSKTNNPNSVYELDGKEHHSSQVSGIYIRNGKKVMPNRRKTGPNK